REREMDPFGDAPTGQVDRRAGEVAQLDVLVTADGRVIHELADYDRSDRGRGVGGVHRRRCHRHEILLLRAGEIAAQRHFRRGGAIFFLTLEVRPRAPPGAVARYSSEAWKSDSAPPSADVR